MAVDLKDIDLKDIDLKDIDLKDIDLKTLTLKASLQGRTKSPLTLKAARDRASRNLPLCLEDQKIGYA